MAKRIDLFDSTYSHFTEQILETIRKDTFGQDMGQNSWTTVEEYDRFISWLDLRPEHHVLEVASGSGGPARYLADSVSCRVTGIDANEAGVATAGRGRNAGQMIPGWPYSVVAALGPGATSRTAPLDAVRLGPDDDRPR